MIKNFETPILKTTSNVIYCIMAQPDIPDLQDDVWSREEIQKAAHQFLEESRIINNSHTDEILAVSVVESWVSKGAGTLGQEPYAAGSWLVGIKINDPTLLDRIKKRDFTGLSIEGTGTRSVA